jgi:hypothetical protein
LLTRGIFCEAYILLTHGIFCEAYILLTLGILFFEATARYGEPKKAYALVP